jgi:Helicase subunit of the DNA excision repair complex
MPSNNSKYSDELREETAKLIINTGRSATSFAEEMGIDINTVCRWVRDYRRKHKMPSYAESKGIKPKDPVSDKELQRKNKELEQELKKLKKQLEEEREKVAILKKSLRIFMQPTE